MLAQIHSNGTIRIAHADELGKVLAMTDNNGALTDEFAYQPYGRMVAHSGATDTPFLFMGDYGVWHAGQGLYLTRHRAYDAHLMRFTSRDPIGLNGGANLYVYGGNNPVAFLDSLGLCKSPSWGQGEVVVYYHDEKVLKAPLNAAYYSAVQTFAPSQDASTPAAQAKAGIIAAPIAFVSAPFAMSAGTVIATEVTIEAAVVYATSSPVSVPATIRIINAALGPDEPVSEFDEFIAGEITKVGVESWNYYKEDDQ